MLWWQESLATGNELIDKQHKSIFDQTENILSLEAGQVDKDLEEIFKFLINYVSTHFGHEESLMIQKSYPDFKKHREEHTYFTNELYNIVKRAVDAGSLDQEYTDSLKLLVIEWLADHIHVSDRNFVNYLNELQEK